MYRGLLHFPIRTNIIKYAELITDVEKINDEDKRL